MLRKVGSRPGFVTWWPLGPGEPLSPQLPCTPRRLPLEAPAVTLGQRWLLVLVCIWEAEIQKGSQYKLSWRVGVLRREGKKKKAPTLQFVSMVGNMRDGSVGDKPLLLVFWLHK